MKFDHRVAVITGAAGNIGFETAKILGRNGVKLALTDFNLEGVEKVSGELRRAGYNARAYRMDVTKMEEIRSAAEAILRDFDKVDILINNAGCWPRGGFLEVTEKEWLKVVDLNLSSVFRVTRAFAPGMAERNYGRIINLGSIAGEVGLPGYSAYAASKAGVIMLTKTLAMEFAKYQITVNSVSPGLIATEKKATPGTWLGRAGTGDEVGRVIAMLADDDAGFITGVDYTVDGGRILGPRNAQY